MVWPDGYRRLPRTSCAYLKADSSWPRMSMCWISAQAVGESWAAMAGWRAGCIVAADAASASSSAISDSARQHPSAYSPELVNFPEYFSYECCGIGNEAEDVCVSRSGTSTGEQCLGHACNCPGQTLQAMAGMSASCQQQPQSHQSHGPESYSCIACFHAGPLSTPSAG